SQPSSETRTSYHVGRPWMFDGKMLRGLTGTPMRRIALAKRVLAEAEPEPFTFANLMTKSFVVSMRFMSINLPHPDPRERLFEGPGPPWQRALRPVPRGPRSR